MADIEKLANILGAETIKRIYEDGLSGSVQEIGKILTDITKTLRLFALPFQVGADIQERLTRQLNRVRESVPEERQQQAPAHIAGTVIERLKYLEDDNYLTDLYLNLLKRAIDKDRINEAHPAFIHIIDQLSPDEAYLLFQLTKNRLIIYEGSLCIPNGKALTTLTEKAKLVFPENKEIYITHLDSLNLITFINNVITPPGKRYDSGTLYLSQFGKLFVKACIPENGFNFVKPD